MGQYVSSQDREKVVEGVSPVTAILQHVIIKDVLIVIIKDDLDVELI